MQKLWNTIAGVISVMEGSLGATSVNLEKYLSELSPCCVLDLHGILWILVD